MAKIFGHRGASGYAPENTLASFQLAADQGADGVELDVQMTKDGEIVVIHDETVDRTTTGSGLVKDLTLKQIRTLNASSGSVDYPDEKVPTLDEVFDLLAPTTLIVNVELKDGRVLYPGMAERLLKMIDERNWEYRVTISSFNHISLAQIRALGSLVYTGVLFQDILFEPWHYAHQMWATALHPHYLYVDGVPDLVDSSHASLLEVNVWTVNEVADIDRMLARDVDAIITNYPDRAIARRERLGD